MTDDTTVPAPQTAVERDGYSVASQSASIAGWTVVSRITGFARAVVIAAVLGPTFFGNLFQALNTFPNLVYELVLGSLIASLLVPPLVAAIDDGDEDRAGRIADGVLGLTTILFVAAVVVVMAASPILLHALAVGIDDPASATSMRI
jgi:putative peptidoglycan lipid II flippase